MTFSLKKGIQAEQAMRLMDYHRGAFLVFFSISFCACSMPLQRFCKFDYMLSNLAYWKMKSFCFEPSSSYDAIRFHVSKIRELFN